MKKMNLLWIVMVMLALGCSGNGGGGDSDTGDTVDTQDDSDTNDADTDDTDTPAGTDRDSETPFVVEPYVEKEACSLDALDGSTILGNFCAANETYCNGVCMDIAGQIEAGCELVTINAPNMDGIAVDDTYLYFNSVNNLYRTNLTTYQTECLLGGLSFPEDILLYDSHLYVGWEEDFGRHGMVRVGIDGSNPEVITRNSWGATNFTVAEDQLFFTGETIWDDHVFSIPLAGGPTVEVYTEGMGTNGYAVLDGYVYTQDYDLVRAEVGHYDTWEELVSSSYGYNLFEVDGTLYWTADRTGTNNWPELYAYNPGDAEPTEIQELEDHGRYIAHNDTTLFFTKYGENDNETEHIYSVPLSGGTVETVGTFEYQSITVAMATNTHLYVRTGQNHTTGGIFRIAL